MTGYRDKAWEQIAAAISQNHALRVKMNHMPADSEMAQMLRREQREIIDRLINLASLDGLGRELLPHPPVPEQAATPEQASWIAENEHWWAGWQPGWWPVTDPADPRGWRWDNPLEPSR